MEKPYGFPIGGKRPTPGWYPNRIDLIEILYMIMIYEFPICERGETLGGSSIHPIFPLHLLDNNNILFIRESIRIFLLLL